MRSSQLRSLVLLLLGAGVATVVACADNASDPLGLTVNEDPTGTPSAKLDGGARPDGSAADLDASAARDGGPTIKDASVDVSPKDSGTDATVVDAGPTTPLFFLGDFATNNTVQLGRALVPSTATSALVVTSAAGAVAKQVVAFDALADGSKVALAADLTVTGRFDLVLAGPDGSGATTLAAMPATGGVTAISISPDGQKVAFLADAETDGDLDAYVVPLQGGAAPVRVSPTRAAGATPKTLNAQSLAWSRDSVYLAIAGDFTVDKKNELYVVDATAAVPAPVAALPESALPAPAGTGTVGVNTGLSPVWTAGGKVCVKGDLTGVAPPSFRLYCASSDGTGFAAPTNLPASPAQIGSYGVSPDGLTLALSADVASAGAFEIYTMKSDDSAPPARVTSGKTVAVSPAVQGPSFYVPLVFSPDGTKIAFVGDLLTDTKDELFVVAADGATPEKRVVVVGKTIDRTVRTFAWSPDSAALAFVGDHRNNNDFELFRIPSVTAADQVPLLVRGVVVSGDVTALAWRP